ncbi:hypothetical protein ACPCHT_24990 [Nucisporomicrobium flavum]|uniref:hypothetical protein n=1 Tax=Nucisporomicrobium flavum TaxID=2785915 RepID=UPI003C30036F
MNLPECRRRLAAAGLEVLDPWPPDGGLVTPIGVAWSASSAGPDDGRTDRTFADTDADRVDFANATWLQVSEEYGLMGDDGTFLVGVNTGDDPVSTWFRARLRQEFDLFGLGAEQRVLGYGWGNPEFVMHSADGNVLIAASSYELFFSIIVIPRPFAAGTLRRAAKRRLAAAVSESEMATLTLWLERRPGQPAGSTG